jgi:hypothetical protein
MAKNRHKVTTKVDIKSYRSFAKKLKKHCLVEHKTGYKMKKRGKLYSFPGPQVEKIYFREKVVYLHTI